MTSTSRTDNSLRNYVRFDKDGRVIPGTLITRRSKPKGDWVEISSGLCCTETTTTTMIPT